MKKKTESLLHTFHYYHCIIVLCMCIVNRSMMDTNECKVCVFYTSTRAGIILDYT
jgi:hypothetical protein